MVPPQAAGAAVAPGDSVLVLCPVLAAADEDACVDLLTVTDPAEAAVLSVAFTQSVRERVAIWTEHADATPAESVVVSVDPAFGDGGADDGLDHDSHAGGDITVERVDDAEDLTTLGVRVADHLDRWTGSDRQSVVCFHSVTPLLQYVPTDRAYEFLDTVTARCAEAGAVAHAHMDPLAHDAETVATFATLFDSVVRPAE